MKIRWIRLVLTFITVSTLTQVWVPVFAEDSSFSPYVDASGAIQLPDQVETTFAHIGSWYVPEGELNGFHDVYTQSSTVEAYRKTGKFPDGTVLVQHVRPAASGVFTSGSEVFHAKADATKSYVMIRDRKRRFKENPIWGEGWGWALFEANSPNVNQVQKYRGDCIGCHVPAKKTDWVYIEGYPVLHRAKKNDGDSEEGKAG